MEESKPEVMTLYQARTELDRQGVRFGQAPHVREGVISAFGPDGTELSYRRSDDATFYAEALERLGREVFIVPALDSDQYGQRTDGACPMCVSLNTDHGTKFTYAYRIELFQVQSTEIDGLVDWVYPEGTNPDDPYDYFEGPRGVCLDCGFVWVPRGTLDDGFSAYVTLDMEARFNKPEWWGYLDEMDMGDDH